MCWTWETCLPLCHQPICQSDTRSLCICTEYCIGYSVIFIVFSLHCMVLWIIAPLPHLERNGDKKNVKKKKSMHKFMKYILFKGSESRLILWNPPLTKINGCEYHYTNSPLACVPGLPLKTCLFDLSWSTIRQNSRRRVYLSTVLFSGFFFNLNNLRDQFS